MEKILISLPESLAKRMRAAIPLRQRSKTIANLIESEILKREASLYQCALEVEQDQALAKEMEMWDTTANDGLDDESW